MCGHARDGTSDVVSHLIPQTGVQALPKLVRAQVLDRLEKGRGEDKVNKQRDVKLTRITITLGEVRIQQADEDHNNRGEGL